MNLLFLALLSVAMLFIKYPGSFRWLVRLGAISALGLTAYETALGKNEGFTFVWFYPVPIAIFFLLGEREGAFWAIVSMVTAFALLIGIPGFHIYPGHAAMVFTLTFGLVCILAYVLESSRHRLVGRLHRESEALRRALDQVETLNELLPICAECKSIRDDQGFWHQIESYIEAHTAAELESARCPDCAGHSDSFHRSVA